MKKICWLFCLYFVSLNGLAQDALLNKKEDFTRGDTLRGTLSDIRSWFDVTYYHLNIKVDPDRHAIGGHNEIHFLVKSEAPNNRMQLDLFDNLNVDSIVCNGKQLKYEREFNAVFIDLAETLPVNSVQQLKFYYSGKPTIAKRAPWDGGFVWEEDLEGNPWVGVACQGIGASIWWPNKDHQSDEPDSMRITGTVPANLKFVANGQSEGSEDMGDWKSYTWFVSNPINNYGVSVNVANYTHFNDQYVSEGDTLQLNYYVLPYNLEKAKKQFEQVKPMMKCFEYYLGQFPFWEDGFALVETPYLGMEHQSGIAYGNQYKTGYAGMDYSRIGLDFDYIIIHEAGHEWWGNNITSFDIADMWIHEGFCTYSEALYVECMHDYETAMDYVNAKKPGIGNKKPIIGVFGVNKEGSGDMYNKGMLFLNTVRHVIGEDQIWLEILRGIQADFRHGIVNTDTIINYMNRKSGKQLDKIFEQYLEQSKIPTLQYKVKKKRRKTIVSYKWKADVADFDMPIQYTNKKGELTWIQPTTDKWQKMTLKKVRKAEFEPKNKDFRFAHRAFYVDFELVD